MPNLKTYDFLLPQLNSRLFTSFFPRNNNNWRDFTVMEAILTDTPLQYTLHQSSASGTHNHSSRLQPFCFLANNLTSITFHNPSYSFHHQHLESFNSKIFHQDLSCFIHSLISHTGNSMHKMNRISDAAKVSESPMKSVRGIRAMIDGDKNIATPPSLAGLPLQLRLRHLRNQRRQNYFSPIVLIFFYLGKRVLN